jgi:8-oxo-dGTP pyrophosphatase MutT (NUDIX family)
MAADKIIRLDEYRRPARDGGKSSPADCGATPDPAAKKSQKTSGKRDWVFCGFSAPTPFLNEVMNSAEQPTPLPADQRVLQSGVLAYRRRKDREPEILLVSKRRSKNWGIPKGNVEPQLSFGESAAKEAFEEAGVLGLVSPYPIGVFRARKRLSKAPSHQVIEVWIYLLEVTETLSNWPEKGKRQIKWVSCETAARHLREPVLAQLCHRLAQS